MALVTDYVFADDQALRYSLLIVTTLAVLGSVVLLKVSLKPYRDSLLRLQQWVPTVTSEDSLAQPKTA